MLSDFLRVQKETEVEGFCIRWAIVPPTPQGDPKAAFFDWQARLKPVLHKILARESLTRDELGLLLEHAQAVVHQLPQGSTYYRAWDFGSTFGLFCQIALEVYQSKDPAPRAIRFCPECDRPIPAQRRPNAKGCSPECSAELKRRTDRERYRRGRPS